MNKLEKTFSERKEKEQNKGLIISNNVVHFPKFDDDIEINDYLCQTGLKILNIGIKSELAVGQALEEAFKKLGNSKAGTYQKFLGVLGINPRKALRMRMRFQYFAEFKTLGYEKAKELVAVIPIIYLERLNSLYKDSETKEILLEYFKDENIDITKMKDLIDTELQEKKIQNKSEEILDNSSFSFSFSNKWKVISKLSKKVEKLPDDKQKEVIEYLDKIKLIIDESEEVKEVEEAEIIDDNNIKKIEL